MCMVGMDRKGKEGLKMGSTEPCFGKKEDILKIRNCTLMLDKVSALEIVAIKEFLKEYRKNQSKKESRPDSAVDPAGEYSR